MLHQPAKVLARQGSVGDHTHTFRSVRDFPRLADRDLGWKFFSEELFQPSPAPDALFENRMKRQRIEHAKKSECRWKSLSRGGGLLFQIMAIRAEFFVASFESVGGREFLQLFQVFGQVMFQRVRRRG